MRTARALTVEEEGLGVWTWGKGRCLVGRGVAPAPLVTPSPLVTPTPHPLVGHTWSHLPPPTPKLDRQMPVKT